MRKLVTVVICLLVPVAASSATGASAPDARSLTRVAAKLSGLRARARVRVVVLPRPAFERHAVALLDRTYPPARQSYDETLYRALGLLGPAATLRPFLVSAALRAQALYDTRTHIVYATRGVARRVLVAEVVHALQDQRFGLRRVELLSRSDRDAAAAALAALDGDVAFATRALGVRSSTAPTESTRLGDFLALEQGFPRATGLRFVTTLHNIGGNRAVFGALRSFPLTTQHIFHVDAFLERRRPQPIFLPPIAAGFGLAQDDTFGELDVRALLAVFGVPRLDAAASGWTGGRSGLYVDGAGNQAVVLRIDWAAEPDAARWDEAVQQYVARAFGPATVGQPCASVRCWRTANGGIAFDRSGLRTAVAFAGDATSASSLSASSLR